MVPMQNFSLKQYRGENRKYNERDGFLHYFQLHERERPAVSGKAYPVCRNLAHILKKCYRPTENNHSDQRQGCKPTGLLLQFQMTIPSKCHEYVGYHQQTDCVQCFHFSSIKKRVQRYSILCHFQT